MTDERLRSLERRVHADADLGTGMDLERLDRERVRAGEASIKVDLVTRLVHHLRERAIDAALSWTEWRLRPSPGWELREVTGQRPPLPVYDLVRSVERDQVYLRGRNAQGKQTALHVEIGWGSSVFLVAQWTDFCPPTVALIPGLPGLPPYTRSRRGILLDQGLTIRAPLFLGTLMAWTATARGESNLSGSALVGLERIS